MKILVLTPINPILNQEPFQAVSRMFAEDKQVSVISFPFHADTHARMSKKQYIPVLFGMMKAMEKDEDLKKKIYNTPVIIVVGNSFDNDFDHIVAFDQRLDRDEEVFDSYIEMLENSEETRILYDIEGLILREEAQISVPTVSHLQLFLKSVLDTEKRMHRIKE